ncbi:hypothetical protein GCM10022261_21610 [Brevibacterium daeguense]|uniref:Type II secretion system protein GspF domain-containing protein n=1 Tax=Brevibacterium daeguense TaxID=909936 RepID=A0ABP8EKW7_9MICO|nr:type II secretion system F family protein [Brevibacterium daeguense]
MIEIIVGALAGGLVGFGWWLLGGGVGHRLRELTRVGAQRSGAVTCAADIRSGAPSERGGAAIAGTSRVDALAFDLDLVSICLQSGLPTERALSLAASAGGDRTGLDRLGRSLALGEVDGSNEELAAVGRLVLFSRSTGVALAPLLRGLAGDLRRAEHRRRQVAAARLGVELVIPLGVCILPAFILLGVVPVVLSLVDDMGILFG